MQVSPALRATGTYPFVKLEQAKRRLAAQGIELIDFGKGDPMEATDPAIRQALVDALANELAEDKSLDLVPLLRRLNGARSPDSRK